MTEPLKTEVMVCPKLVCLTMSNRGLSYSIDGDKKVEIGRSEDCDFVVDNAIVSGRHCTITPISEHVVMVSDLDSTNGTFVNGTRLKGKESLTLNVGDILRLGCIEFLYEDARFRPEVVKGNGRQIVDLNRTEIDSVSTKCRNMSPFCADPVKEGKLNRRIIEAVIVLGILGIMAVIYFFFKLHS